MKHVSNKSWSSVGLLYNEKKGILLRGVGRDYIFEIRRRMSNDKNYISWLRREENERYQEEMGRVEFDDLMSKHGYDELCHDTDYSECFSVIHRINHLIKQKAIKDRAAKYTIYKESGSAIKSICRCGDWYFVFNDYSLVEETKDLDYEKIDSVKKSGGARVGAGRKSQYSKLKYPETTSIKVPKWEKEDIKKLIEWIIDNDSSKVIDAILTAVSDMKWSASKMDEYSLEGAAKHREQAVLLDELWKKIPRFYYAEENVTDSKESDK